MEVFMKFKNASRALTMRLIGSAVTTALVLQVSGCGQSDKNRVAVHPVTGSVQFRGLPTAGAFVSLHAKNATDSVPTPRATVAKDGTFTVTTYDGNDGAPEGDYVLTVQWYRPVRVGNDLVGGPNVLPVKYASAQTSDVKIRIAAGENQLKLIHLR
jgi:hypothetical protein